MIYFYYNYKTITNKNKHKLSLTYSKCTSTMGVMNIISSTQIHGNIDNYMDDYY